MNSFSELCLPYQSLGQSLTKMINQTPVAAPVLATNNVLITAPQSFRSLASAITLA